MLRQYHPRSIRRGMPIHETPHYTVLFMLLLIACWNDPGSVLCTQLDTLNGAGSVLCTQLNTLNGAGSVLCTQLNTADVAVIEGTPG